MTQSQLLALLIHRPLLILAITRKPSCWGSKCPFRPPVVPPDASVGLKFCFCHPTRYGMYLNNGYMPFTSHFVDYKHRKVWKIVIFGPIGPLFAPHPLAPLGWGSKLKIGRNFQGKVLSSLQVNHFVFKVD